MAELDGGLARAGGDLARVGRDPDAFEAFYRRHVEAISRFVARRVADPHTAADLTAEVFVAVIEFAHTYRPDLGSEIGWLYGVARNVLAAERRRAARELRVTGRVAGRRLVDADDIARLEERIDAESAARHTYEALAGLPEGVRAVLELIAVDGLTVTEAAGALGIRPVTARVRLHRARKVLARIVPEAAPALAYAKE
ncbi:sigma-70 family RNA polymerase sigma factor [Actinomadura barringtoniae]|uniref:Sigma-70 family RNA polymerase sigma factor n=1 Tax=Actinomadura barringtoniae TaxID=1427535 RepID=A0A939T5S5_9ACTN|nr:sigma-70 family RNA polymerase sigma factor [Actinomadura barringtoniae]MBO2450968.1 sigma-70 family RNA polymerase sigma factor [Actinomadura barringtoniae]